MHQPEEQLPLGRHACISPPGCGLDCRPIEQVFGSESIHAPVSRLSEPHLHPTSLLEFRNPGFVSYYNYRRYYKTLGNVTLLNVLQGSVRGNPAT